jgi:hypothetical protein
MVSVYSKYSVVLYDTCTQFDTMGSQFDWLIDVIGEMDKNWAFTKNGTSQWIFFFRSKRYLNLFLVVWGHCGHGSPREIN